MRDTTQTIFAIGSFGLGIIALVNKEARTAVIVALIVTLAIAAIYVKIMQFSENIDKQNKKIFSFSQELSEFKKQQDVYKKIYKLESAIHSLRMKKGAFKPEWLLSALVIIVLLYFILKTVGVI